MGGISGRSRERRARRAQREAGRQARETYQPFYTWGLEAINRPGGLRELMEDPTRAFEDDPQFQFLQQEGSRALGNVLAGRGKLLSGESFRASQQFGQNLSSTYLGTIIDRLFKQVGVGERAATGIANAHLGQGRAVAETLQGQSPLLAGIQQGVGTAFGMQSAGFLGGGGGGATPSAFQPPNFSPLSAYNAQGFDSRGI